MRIFLPLKLTGSNAIVFVQRGDPNLTREGRERPDWSGRIPMADYQQKDFHTVTPYLYGRLDLIEFLKQAFNAEVRFQGTGTGNEDGYHAEIKIGDSIVMLGIAKSIPREFGPPS